MFFLERSRGGNIAFAIVVAVIAVLLLTANDAHSTPTPPGTVAVKAEARVVALIKANGQSKIVKAVKATCKATTQASIYTCDFYGQLLKTGKVRCIETYVYDAGGKQSFWQNAWVCGTKPDPVPIPPRPTQTGPTA